MRLRRLAGVDELVISLTAKGLTTGEISAHLAGVYGAEVSRDTISRITDAVVEELAGWQSRPLDPKRVVRWSSWARSAGWVEPALLEALTIECELVDAETAGLTRELDRVGLEVLCVRRRSAPWRAAEEPV